VTLGAGLLANPGASASATLPGCDGMTGNIRSSCVLSAALGSTLALPLRQVTVNSSSGTWHPAFRAGVTEANGMASGTLDGARYRGKPELFIDEAGSFGSEWRAVDVYTAPAVGVDPRVASQHRQLEVETIATSDNQMLFNEVDFTEECLIATLPGAVGPCNHPVSEVVVGPRDGTYYWHFSTGRATLTVPFEVSEKIFSLVGGRTPRVLKHTEDTGLWTVTATSHGSAWSFLSKWVTGKHGSGTTTGTVKPGRTGTLNSTAHPPAAVP
jgi:hypothetical protein